MPSAVKHVRVVHDPPRPARHPVQPRLLRGARPARRRVPEAQKPQGGRERGIEPRPVQADCQHDRRAPVSDIPTAVRARSVSSAFPFVAFSFLALSFPILSYSAAAFPASSLRGGAYCRRFPPVSPRVLQRDSLRAVLILVFLAHAAATRPAARLSAFRHP